MVPLTGPTHHFPPQKLPIEASIKNGTKIILDTVVHRVYFVGLQRRGV